MYYYKDIAAHCQVSRRVIHVNGEVKSSVHVNERGWGRYEDHIWEGMASERRVLTRRSAAGAKGFCAALRSFVDSLVSRRVLARRSAAGAMSFALLCVLPLRCGLCGASLRRLWLR